jgi:hypothetical protein
MAVPQTEAPQAIVVASKLQKDLFILLRAGFAQPLEAHCDGAPPRQAVLRIRWPPSCGRIQSIDAADQRRISLRIRLNQEPAHVLRDPLRQDSDGRSLLGREEVGA